ncbi:MAG TPA: ABC transporter permease [Acidimicrobiales bacterium]|nr:ABC transporter permease [Acidimicrobiales bacterium]
MKFIYILLVAAGVVTVRLALFRARRRRPSAERPAEGPELGRAARPARASGLRRSAMEGLLGDVGLVASREIQERLRGRIFRVGTVVMLVAVIAVVVIPALHKSGGPTPQKIGVVGFLPAGTRQAVLGAGRADQDAVSFVPEGSLAAAAADLRAGRTDVTIVDADELLVDRPLSSSNSPADPVLVRDVADYLGVLKAYREAGLSPLQAVQISNAKPVAVLSLAGSSKSRTSTTSVIGLVLLFFMLTQYCTWILIGVMQEKSSRVVEVLLAMVRPIQLLAGKVIGIGVVALGQATLIVGAALAVGAAVGSDLLHGTAPLALLSELLWLLLGYAFYCWVYAAAGSTAERQDQVQTLALPLSLPILFGYVYSITVASTGSPSLFFKVLAYFPPTAPFCMSVLDGLSQVTWWEFVCSALVSVAATWGAAVLAARIYRRAVLRTGARVHILDLVGRRAH